jgi:hypothetical protein
MFQLMRKSVGGGRWSGLCCRRLMWNCAGTERYKGLNSLDAGAGNRTSMNEFGCNKESMEEYAEERGGKSD